MLQRFLFLENRTDSTYFNWLKIVKHSDQGRIQRLNLAVAFWMKSTCVAEGHALPRGVWVHAERK